MTRTEQLAPQRKHPGAPSSLSVSSRGGGGLKKSQGTLRPGRPMGCSGPSERPVTTTWARASIGGLHLAGRTPQQLRRRARRDARRWLADPDAVLLDTETTDFHGQVIDLAVTRMDGTVLLNTLIQPREPVNEEARAKHRISDEELQDAPLLEEIAGQIRDVLRGRRVIAYNASFDRGILMAEQHRIGAPLLAGTRWVCAMRAYACFQGTIDPTRGRVRWPRLPGAQHRALGDCLQMGQVLHEIAEVDAQN